MDAKMLDGKVAIISGASYGMGYTMAELFAKEGAKVVMTARGKEKLDAAVQEIRKQGYDVTGVAADNKELEDVKKVIQTAMDTYGDLDIVINNAAIGEQKMIDETDDEWLEHVYQTNVFGPFRFIRGSLKVFLPKNEGCIINISSVNGERPFCGASYTPSKGAINTLTKNVAMRLIDTNIRINAVAPGATVTPAHLANKAGEQPGGAKMLEFSKHFVYFPGPECDPIDQANACLYLASDMGRHTALCMISVFLALFLSVIGRMGTWLGPNGEGLMNTFSVADHDLGVQPFNASVPMDEIERIINWYSPIKETYELAMQSVTVNGQEYTANVLNDTKWFTCSPAMYAMGTVY